MNIIGSYTLITVFAAIILTGLIKKVKVFDEFLAGASEGLKTSVKILPALIALVVSVSMLRSSGLITVISDFCVPLLNALRIPKEVFPLALMRPVSGSGAFAILEDIFKNYGTDGHIGRVASVMMGSTETTFYTIAIYYGSVGIKKTAGTLPAALAADFTSFVVSALAVSLF